MYNYSVLFTYAQSISLIAPFGFRFERLVQLIFEPADITVPLKQIQYKYVGLTFIIIENYSSHTQRPILNITLKAF